MMCMVTFSTRVGGGGHAKRSDSEGRVQLEDLTPKAGYTVLSKLCLHADMLTYMLMHIYACFNSCFQTWLHGTNSAVVFMC
jgi:hypothetical protein